MAEVEEEDSFNEDNDDLYEVNEDEGGPEQGPDNLSSVGSDNQVDCSLDIKKSSDIGSAAWQNTHLGKMPERRNHFDSVSSCTLSSKDDFFDVAAKVFRTPGLWMTQPSRKRSLRLFTIASDTRPSKGPINSSRPGSFGKECMLRIPVDMFL